MAHSEAYKELISSQIPALQLLINMGWQYLTPNEALELRGGKEKNVILTGVLETWLREHNSISTKGQTYPFSDGNIRDAVNKLVDEPFRSLIITSEIHYELLTLGTSLTQTIDGDRKSFSLHYIDWHNPENNVYHVTDEFTIEKRSSHDKRRPDIVLFVNGIPLVVIECKRPDLDTGGGEKAVAEAVSQMIRNQNEDEIPHLFVYTQLVMALSRNDALYATAGTPKKFWSLWREEADLEADVHEHINYPLDNPVKQSLYRWRGLDGVQARRYFDNLDERLPTEQDRLVYALLRPWRLLELIYQFIVYDGGVKKVARYQQYFAIKATINRVAHRNTQGTRTGGVIWHTTGSGKSLTMVMLAKALALHPNIQNPKVILVTDRVNLDEQIYRTFHACGKSVVQAQSGKHLVRLVRGELKKGDERGDVITTVINKFEEAAREKVHDDDINIFVLVDESHRSQYGQMHTKMARVFPNACYIGFTGTPLTKGEKSTARKFGDFIHKYSMRQAVVDNAVVPLLYEGRIVEQDVDKHQLERWFERTTRHLTDEQIIDLKRKMSRSEAVNSTEQRIREIAYNIAQHYELNVRDKKKGFKGQLATASKRIGYKYWRYLTDYGIEAALVISPPDTREGHEEVDELDEPEIQKFWKQMMDRYATEETFNREMIASFSKPDGIEIMVVVDKLLTGFDEPRNVVLYVDKPLKQHTLLQAIARVNRLAEGKDFGFIIDYRGVLGELNEAMNLYDALADYDVEDIIGTFTEVGEQIKKLPQLHSDLLAIFQPVANKDDPEAMERFLEPEDRRQHFYEALTDYAQALKVALSTTEFYTDTPEDWIRNYKDDLNYFHRLRQSVKMRYAEAVDYREYEDKVRKLMDDHIKATGTTTITELVNIFNSEKFDQEVARLGTPTAKADTILNRMKRTITERMDEDPIKYRRFSELIQDTIQQYRQGRIDELEYLSRAETLLADIRAGRDSSQPAKLARYKHAPAYYGILQAIWDGQVHDEDIADVAINIEEIIEANRVTDWVTNLDIQKAIKQRLDNYFYDLESQTGVAFTHTDLDILIEQIVEVARARDKLI